MNIKYRFRLLQSGLKSGGRLLAALSFFLLLANSLYAQAPEGIEMADKLREDGKIWVVVGVILLIFTGIVIYLIRLDGKISKLEKQLK